MNCKECGRQIPDGALFCKYCGAQVEKSTEDADAPVRPPRRPRRTPPKKKRRTAILLVLVLCLLAVGVLAAITLGKTANSGPGSDQPPAEVTQEPISANISPRNSQVEVGSNLVLSIKLTPDTEKIKSVTWQSSDTAIATVSEGIVRGIAPGQVQITAKLALESGKSAETQTTVRIVAPSIEYTLDVTPSDVSLHVGNATTLAVQLVPAPEETVEILTTVWASSDPSIATVSDGRVTGIAIGSTQISVTCNLSTGQITKATVPVTVTQKPAPVQTPTQPSTDTQAPATQTPAPQTPTTQTPSQTSDFILPDSQTALVSYEKLATLSAYQLRLARNEIYARHGRRFQDAQLQAYFDAKPWYHGTIASDAFDVSVLNDTELANIARIQEVEAKR